MKWEFENTELRERYQNHRDQIRAIVQELSGSELYHLQICSQDEDCENALEAKIILEQVESVVAERKRRFAERCERKANLIARLNEIRRSVYEEIMESEEYLNTDFGCEEYNEKMMDAEKKIEEIVDMLNGF